MIPLQLQLRNFLSYGPTVQMISFDPYHLICLSGKNGHGKSALLDAITWALWGQARKISGATRADEGLLHLGETHMFVSFDFLCNGQTYRVRREFTFYSSKSYTMLDFGVVDKESGLMRALTDKTIRLTQEKIIQTLGLDYDSFINSVFLRQGQSNEFSKKSPKERKEIFATILGLAKYEELKKKAVEKMRAIATERDHLVRMSTLLQQQVSGKEMLAAQIAEKKEAFARLTDQEHDLSNRQQELKEAQHALEQQLQQQELVRRSLERSEKEYQDRLQQWRSLVATYRSVVSQVRLSKELNMQHKDRAALEDEYRTLQQQMALHLELKEKQLHLKAEEQACVQRINQYHAEHHTVLLMQKQKVEHGLQVAARQLDELNVQHKNKEAECAKIAEKLSQLQQKTHVLEQGIIAAGKLEERLERMNVFYQNWQSRLMVINHAVQDFNHKMQLMHDEQNRSCPLCEQHLSAARKRYLAAQFSKDEHKKTVYADRLKKHVDLLAFKIAQAKDACQELLVQREQLKSLERECHDVATVLAAARDVVLDLAKKIEQAREACVDDERRVREMGLVIERHTKSRQALLDNDASYKKIGQDILLLEQGLQGMAAIQVRYQEVMALFAQTDDRRKKQEALLQESYRQEQRRQDIHERTVMLKRYRSEIAGFRHSLSSLADLQKDMMMIMHKDAEQKRVLSELRRSREVLLQELGALEEQLRVVVRKEEELVEYKKQSAVYEEEGFQYQTLATAFGKDGIQALLIEEAIPEVEQEANSLLAKLTDNQAHLTIDSLRDLKSGGTKETLEIKISDALGIRPYEMFSGGEAFRIDFALRIALSKLLARRAGTSLQTLIIDEGFGSQDEDGLHHIMDALYKIQEDFAKIIIVSHLSSMKDQFPVHFVVSKGPSGSSVTVIEQA